MHLCYARRRLKLKRKGLAGENSPLRSSNAPVEGIERNGNGRSDRNADSRPVLHGAKHRQEVQRVLASVMGLRGAESFSSIVIEYHAL
jgi:hypothetical protein